MKQLERFLKRKLVRQILGDDYVLSDRQAERLLVILDTPKKVKELEDWLPAFAHFVRNDLTNYVGRFRRLKQLPASPSLYSLVLRYGKIEAIVRHKQRQCTSNFSNTAYYWRERGLDPCEAQSRISVIQTERANEAAQVIRGTSEYTCRSVAYWLKKGYPLDGAMAEVHRIQTTNGITAYQERGCSDPEQAQRDRNQKWLESMGAKDVDERRRINLAKSHTIEGCLARGLPPSEAEATLIAYFAKRKNYSQISQVCFDMVRDRVGEDGLYYKHLSYEKQFNGRNVDFFDKASGIVVEFLGDFWHANPLRYDRQDRIYGRLASEVRLDDQRRFANIESHPLVRQVFIVWESEFRENPTEIADFIVDALLEHRNV